MLQRVYRPRNIWNVNVNNIDISKLIETKTNSKYLIRHLNNSKRSGYVWTFKVKDGYKGKSNKLMSFQIDNEKPLEKNKPI